MWTSPLTEKPLLEPCFAAAFHGIELCFLLLAEFVADKRKVSELITHWLWHRRIPRTSDFHIPLIFSTVMPLDILDAAPPRHPCQLLGLRHPIPAVQYVAKRPRIDMVATDIQEQCMLLTEVSHPADPWLILSSAACACVFTAQQPHTCALRLCQILCGMAQHASEQLSLSVSVLPTCMLDPLVPTSAPERLLNPQESHMAGRAGPGVRQGTGPSVQRGTKQTICSK